MDEKKNNNVLDTSQMLLRSNLPPKVTKTSANLSYGEFTGEGM